MADFLEENPSLSPSKIFQSKVEEIQNSIKHNPQLMEALKTITSLQKQKQMVEKERAYMVKFLDSRNLWEEFTKEYPL